MKKKSLPEVEPVHIPSLFGIEPGKWLTLLYIIILFCIFVLPGIVDGHKIVSFESAVPDAAVYVDNNYMQATPFSVSLKSGEHTATFSLYGSKIETVSFKVSHPIFFTLFYKYRMKVSSTALLPPEAEPALSEKLLQDSNDWSRVVSSPDYYKVPDVIGNYKASLGSAANARAVELAELFFDYEGLTDYARDLNSYSAVDMPKRVFLGEIEGWDFGSFTISSQEVSEALWSRFVSENPYWKTAGKDADEYYLKGITNSSKPVRNISYRSAVAFCEWMSDKYGKTVVLPSLAELGTAMATVNPPYQKSLVSTGYSNGPEALYGGVWEFTRDVFAYGLLKKSASEREQLTAELEKYDVSYDRAIFGGSWLKETQRDAVGAIPDKSTSESTGLRIVWY